MSMKKKAGLILGVIGATATLASTAEGGEGGEGRRGRPVVVLPAAPAPSLSIGVNIPLAPAAPVYGPPVYAVPPPVMVPAYPVYPAYPVRGSRYGREGGEGQQ